MPSGGVSVGGDRLVGHVVRRCGDGLRRRAVASGSTGAGAATTSGAGAGPAAGGGGGSSRVAGRRLQRRVGVQRPQLLLIDGSGTRRGVPVRRGGIPVRGRSNDHALDRRRVGGCRRGQWCVERVPRQGHSTIGGAGSGAGSGASSGAGAGSGASIGMGAGGSSAPARAGAHAAPAESSERRRQRGRGAASSRSTGPGGRGASGSGADIASNGAGGGGAGANGSNGGGGGGSWPFSASGSNGGGASLSTLRGVELDSPRPHVGHAPLPCDASTRSATAICSSLVAR